MAASVDDIQMLAGCDSLTHAASDGLSPLWDSYYYNAPSAAKFLLSSGAELTEVSGIRMQKSKVKHQVTSNYQIESLSVLGGIDPDLHNAAVIGSRLTRSTL